MTSWYHSDGGPMASGRSIKKRHTALQKLLDIKVEEAKQEMIAQINEKFDREVNAWRLKGLSALIEQTDAINTERQGWKAPYDANDGWVTKYVDGRAYRYNPKAFSRPPLADSKEYYPDERIRNQYR
jgi:hypothetical protein